MSESPRDDLSTRSKHADVAAVSDRTKLAIGAVLVIALLYSVVILGQVAPFFWLVRSAVILLFLYWFAVSLERIAVAQERRARVAECQVDVTEATDADETVD